MQKIKSKHIKEKQRKEIEFEEELRREKEELKHYETIYKADESKYEDDQSKVENEAEKEIKIRK